MALAAAAAATAATTAGLAYIDAKYHIRQDWAILRGKRKQVQLFEQALKKKRHSLYYFFEDLARDHPTDEAIWSRVGCYTYQQVYDRANQYAQWFLAQGVRPGDLVAFFMINSPDFVLAWIGLMAIGAAPAMINYNLASKALLHCLGISKAKLIIVDGNEDLHTRITSVRPELEAQGFRIVNLEEARPQVYGLDARRPGDELRRDVKPNFPFALFYTSGTTGMPKGCSIPMVAGFFHGIGNAAGTNPVDEPNQRYYDCMPYYHGTGGINVMAQMMNGNTVCIAPKFSASRFWDDVRDSRATWFVYVGETLRYLLAAPESPRDRDHGVHSIYGNGLRPDVWKKFRERFGITRIFEMFNSTEGMLPLDNPARGDFLAHSVGHQGLLQRWKYHHIQVPVAIDTETGDILRNPETGFAYRVPYEEGGEIVIRIPGDREFGGYYNNPEATEKKYVRDLFKKGDCYYRTGDALRRDSDGRWFFMDRLGDTFRWKGENVSTAEVGEILGKYPGVLEANVYGVALPGHDGRAGSAAICVDPAVRDTFDHRDLLSYARKHLPKYAVPVFIRHVKEMAGSHNNKQNKTPLKQEGVDPDKVQGGDEIYWIEGFGKGSTYVPFTRADWLDLQGGKAKL